MHNDRTHPLLAQLPLTVSPFINLPSATTLPYTYKPMPSTLPPSIIGNPSSTPTTTTADQPQPTSTSTAASSTTNPPDANAGANPATTNPSKPKYVVSASGSGHAAHPEEILASCRALHAHVTQLQERAAADLEAVEARIRARELAEKRRVAPGWLDSEARMLEPERKTGAAGSTPAVGAGSGGEMKWEAGAGARKEGEGEDGSAVGGAGGDGDDGRLEGGAGWGYQQHGHGPGVASEMAVPDEGEQLDRAFGALNVGTKP